MTGLLAYCTRYSGGSTLVLAVGFIASIPYTKLRHIFTTSANAFLAPLEPKGSWPPSTWKTRVPSSSARPAMTDLTWKDIFDADACTACKRCQDRCPAYATEKPLSPMKIVAADRRGGR